MTIRIISDREVTLQMQIEVQGKVLQKTMNEAIALQAENKRLTQFVESIRVAVGNQTLEHFIEKHGEPVPIVAERDTLRQQLAEAQALIEASRKQEPVATVRHELRPWEKAVLAPPHPGHFGIPKEHCEAAQHYANFWHQNRLDSVRVKQEAAQPVQVPLTAERIVSACYSFRHDFGLLPQETRDSLTRTATDWAQAFGIGGGQ